MKNCLFDLKVIVVLLFLFGATLSLKAQSAAKARQVLDKTAAIITKKGGASANFSITTDGVGTVSGTILVKGNKFFASTPQAKTWYNGKTQWTYLASANEVTVSNPSAEVQARMNPYRFITMYKSGYNLSMQQQGANYRVHLTPIKKGKQIQEMYVTVNKTTYLPSVIKIKENGKWSTITVKNFKAAQLSDARFQFNSKDYPKCEIIDLR